MANYAPAHLRNSDPPTLSALKSPVTGETVMTAARRPEPIGPDATDADLAIAATSGDRAAFALIYDRYADKLHDFCVGMLRDRDAAADCVQDAFCTAATKLTELREPDKLRPWLYAVTRNEALRRIRERRREQLSDEVPDMASTEAGPDVLAARTELAELIAQAAGGLSDRDRTVLQLAYHHGMDGPELAEALEVSPSAATKMVQRLRDTVERSLGALLVCRRAKAEPDACPELATVLEGWDGTFTVLMRKRVARHIESCPICDEERQRRVTPAALLGATPVLVPAPGWLRERTLESVELPSGTTSPGPRGGSAGGGEGGSRRGSVITAAVLGGLAVLGILVLFFVRHQTSTSVIPADFSNMETTSTTGPQPPAGLLPAPPVATTSPTATTTTTTIATSIAAPPPPPTATDPITTTEPRTPERQDVTTTVPPEASPSPAQPSEEEPEPQVTAETDPSSPPPSPPPTSQVTTSRTVPSRLPTRTLVPVTPTTTIPPIY
jgi:RNA polymerase sigma factor (sigma-70 family)